MLRQEIARDPLAAALQRKARGGGTGASEARPIAAGEGWRVLDIVCTHGPSDRPFEEHFPAMSIALVLAGGFVCRTGRGTSLMSPGSLMLGNSGSPFECSHEYGEGDRCLSFQFAPALFEQIAHDVGANRAIFDSDRIPPLRELAPVIARASTAVKQAAQSANGSFANSLEEIALALAGRVISMVSDRLARLGNNETRDGARIARVLREMATASAQLISIHDLAREAGLSRYHFLRTFKRTTGVTPHQWLLRTRLRNAAERLLTGQEPITEIALDVGFDDLSNFIRSFRAEFGVSPRRYRASTGRERAPALPRNRPCLRLPASSNLASARLIR